MNAYDTRSDTRYFLRYPRRENATATARQEAHGAIFTQKPLSMNYLGAAANQLHRVVGQFLQCPARLA